MAGKAFKVRAPAKINRSLRVVGIRADGYHELRTVFQSIALHDTLAIRVRRGPFLLQCDEPDCPTDQANLVWKAAESVWTASGRRGVPRDVEIALTKRIPLQAGLGGGSSDGAAALRALASLWRVNPSALPGMAASLGADVPYFLEGGTVLGLDRGDLLYPLVDQPSEWVVLVVPEFGVSTAQAFSWWDEMGGPLNDRPSNDLQAPVAAHNPDIARFVGALERAGASCAAMSGSGSAVFGLFDTRQSAERAARALASARRGPAGPGRRRPRIMPGDRGPRIIFTRTLNRSMYQRLAGIRAHRINLPFAPRHPGHS